MLLATYSKPYSYYEQDEICYSHHNQFARLGYECQRDGVLLVANTNKLYANNVYFQDMLLECGFQSFYLPTSSAKRYFLLKILCDTVEFENCMRLCLSDDDKNVKLGKGFFTDFFTNKAEGYTDRRFGLLKYYFSPFGFDDNFRSVMIEPNRRREHYRRNGDKPKDCVKIEGIEMELEARKPYLFHLNQLEEYYLQQIVFIQDNNQHLFL